MIVKLFVKTVPRSSAKRRDTRRSSTSALKREVRIYCVRPRYLCKHAYGVLIMPATSQSHSLPCMHAFVLQRPVGFGLVRGVHERHALLLEAVMTFGLMYAVYATAVDHRSRGGAVAIAPLAIGFVLGANILAGGPFDGAAMNPARAFGPALVGWSWRHHWVYWVGPLIGAGLAGGLYEFVMVEQEPEAPPAAVPRMPVASEDY